MEDNIQQEALIEAPVEQQNEQSFNAQQVADIVKREKARAKEAALREAEARFAMQSEQMQGGQQGQPGANLEADPAMEERLYARFMGDLQKHQEQMEQEAEQSRLKTLANQYHLKMGKGSEIFDDFNDIMADFNPGDFPEVVMAAMQLGGDALPEVMYELARYPQKLVEMNSLVRQSPKLAEREMKKLIQSASSNIEAKQNNVDAPAPLSRLKSSSVGADNGTPTIQDYKKMPWLRG